MENKVQITAVGNIGSKAGYNTRRWTKHGKLPYVDYTGASTGGGSQGTTQPNKPSEGTVGACVGDTVTFTGNKHYVSSNALNGSACKPGKAKVTAMAGNAKHPYHLIKVPGGGSTVYGWVDAADIQVEGGIIWPATTSLPGEKTDVRWAQTCMDLEDVVEPLDAALEPPLRRRMQAKLWQALYFKFDYEKEYLPQLEENLVWLGAELQKLTDYQQRRNTYRKK